MSPFYANTDSRPSPPSDVPPHQSAHPMDTHITWMIRCLLRGSGRYYVHWSTVWRVTRPDVVAAGFNMKALSKGEYEPQPGFNGLHITPLELISIIINAVLDLAWANTVTARAGDHIFRICADNTSALSWTRNMARDTNSIVRCLVRFIVTILVASGIPCILQGKHIPGEENVGANRLSRSTLAPSQEYVLAACPAVKLW
jgi:hypothetical protein